MAATRHGADLMQMGHEVGQIKPGYCADLLILDGDPLADIRIFQDQNRILAVMKDGQFAKARRHAIRRDNRSHAQDSLNQSDHRCAGDVLLCRT